MYCSLQVDLYNNCFELHAEGDLMIAGTKKKLHVIILNNMLLIVKEQKCGLLEYKTHIKVSFSRQCHYGKLIIFILESEHNCD